MKRYDQKYFDKWYRNPGSRISTRADVRRKVLLAVSVTEFFLRRPLRSVLDVGCGEAPWREHLRELRPRITYLGLDPSEYVVSRFGTSRNIRQATFGQLPELKLAHTYDLIVCSDALHYVPDAEIPAGLAEIARLLDGVAFLEVLTREDDIVGDLDGLIKRPAAWYRQRFEAAGLVFAGPYCWLSPALREGASQLEASQD